MQVKICGIRDAEALRAAAEAGADLVGFVFFPPSPRAVTPGEAAALSATVSGGPLRVGLFVDPTDEALAATLAAIPLGILQLHGEETPERCAAIRARFGRPVMKALGIASPADLDALAAYAPSVDHFLLDAKAPPGAPLSAAPGPSGSWSGSGRSAGRSRLRQPGYIPQCPCPAGFQASRWLRRQSCRRRSCSYRR